MKRLACWSPNKYGNRVALDHAGGVSINVVTGVPISGVEQLNRSLQARIGQQLDFLIQAAVATGLDGG